tara:strand:- start:6419 stop:7399 length:981 start_codon:yes stop_codon:yes gene_type:complete
MIGNINNILKSANMKSTQQTFPQLKKIISLNYESPQKVILAGLALKIYDSNCDTRYHQKTNGGKYSLRSIEIHTSAWGASQGFFSTHCPGTLSNALRHKEPYDMNYSRVWRSQECKTAFLGTFDMMNTHPVQCHDMLIYMLQLLKELQQQHLLLSTRTISTGVDLYTLLCNLCTLTYNKSSLIPVHIVYTYYKMIKKPGLISLKPHNSPDIKGKSYADIEVHNEGENSIIIEIKHGLEIQDQYIISMARKTRTIKSKNYIFTSLIHQKYYYNEKYDCVIWNVASFVHYNLYNSNNDSLYIQLLHKSLMSSNFDLHVKENIQKCFIQ